MAFFSRIRSVEQQLSLGKMVRNTAAIALLGILLG